MGRHSGLSNTTRDLFEEKVAAALAAPVAGSRVASRRAARLANEAKAYPVPAPAVPVVDTPSEAGMLSVLPQSSTYRGVQTTATHVRATPRPRAALVALAAAASGIAAIGASPSLTGASLPATDAIEAAALTTPPTQIQASPAALAVSVDGEVRNIETTATTIGEALREAGIVLGEKDRVSISLASPVLPGAAVEIIRVETLTITEEETIAHETIREEDDTLTKGTEKVATKGVDGLVSKTYEVTKEGGVETGRELVMEATIVEKVDEVIKVGTKEPEADTSAAVATGVATAVPAGSAQEIAHAKVLGRGWGEDQFSCLVTLWNRESHWNAYARNPYSGAYGIPQALPGSKMASAGADWATNPATQIEWGLGYISGRYGTPCGALGHSYSVGWY